MAFGRLKCDSFLDCPTFDVAIERGREFMAGDLQHQMRFKGAETCQIMRGREHVDERHRRLHAACNRLISRTAEQGIQPNQPAGVLLQLRERVRELFRLACVPAVAQNYHDRLLIDAAKPLRIERRETCADARAA